MSKTDEIKQKFEEEVEKIRNLEKDHGKCLVNMRQLESQLTENNMVKEELDRLEAEAKVYKLIGPVLVKQDLQEAKENVRKRIEYINTETKRVESVLADLVKSIDTQKTATEKLREEFLAAAKK